MAQDPWFSQQPTRRHEAKPKGRDREHQTLETKRRYADQRGEYGKTAQPGSHFTDPLAAGLRSRAGAADRRIREAAITPQGKTATDAVDAAREKLALTLFQDWNRTDFDELLRLLRMLAEKAGQPVSRDEILAKIWGLEGAPTNRTVDNFVVKLRKKIEKSPEKPQHILTVYGYGYKLAP